VCGGRDLKVKTGIRKIIAVMTVSLLGLLSAPSLLAQEIQPCGKVDLPLPIVETIKTKFPGWRPKDIVDLGTDDRQLWLKAHPKGCPGIAVGHYKSAGMLSYAVLLVPQSRPTGGYRILVFSKAPQGPSYSSTVLAHADTDIQPGMVIATAPPAKYPSFDDLKSVTLKRDGLYVEVIEKGIELYFWTGSKYSSIQIWN
jgi:hypothetical protein